MGTLAICRQERIIAAFIPGLERLVAEAMDEWQIPRLAMTVVQNGEVALVGACGLRDVEAGVKVATDTQFMICSITKSFTSTGLALLVDERRLDWKKPVRDYASRPHEEGDQPFVAVRLVHNALQCILCVAQTEDLVHDARERWGGIDDNPVFGNVFFRLMQARNEFPFRWFSAPVSWVQCHSLINPPETGVEVDLKDKHAVK